MIHCDKVMAPNTRACKNHEFQYAASEEITSFVEDKYLSYLVEKMADRGSRVASALNFLTDEDISYHPDGCKHSALESLIQEYFNNRSSDDRIDDSSDESDHISEGLTITWLNHILLLYKHYR